MKIFKALKSFVCYGSVYFTAIASFMLILGSGQTNQAPDSGKFLLILLLSFIFALGSTLYRIEEINRPLAATLHAAIYILGFLLFMVLCQMGFARSVIGTVIFAIVYTAITIPFRLISKSIKKSLTKEEKNVSVATKKEKAKEKNNEKEINEYKNLFS